MNRLAFHCFGESREGCDGGPVGTVQIHNTVNQRQLNAAVQTPPL